MDITIRSFNGIGDLLFVTPTLEVVKKAYPAAHIMVNTNYPDLLAANPYVDRVGTLREGVFMGYPDPIHGRQPVQHHILSDWEIICRAYGLQTDKPDLKPQIYIPYLRPTGKVGVQVIHKGHWHAKKVWPRFAELAALPGYEPIPKCSNILELVGYVADCRAVVCAEGGISHIARAVGTPAVVIYGGFADPAWNGYEDQINIVNRKSCSYCYNPSPCVHEIERCCMREITVEQVRREVEKASE